MTTSARSPRYPIIGLKEAVEKAKAVYAADHRNRIPKELVAKHIGYGGLNGKSLGVISAISKFGLLEGRSDQMWVSDRAIDIFENGIGNNERVQAVKAAADEPELFRELTTSFPGKVSDAALRSFLITKRKFLPDAAERSVRSYRETREFLNTEVQADNGTSNESDASSDLSSAPALQGDTPPTIQSRRTASNSGHALHEGERREIITLDEGDVVISFPKNLSLDSCNDLRDHLNLLIKKIQRRASRPDDEQPI